MRRASKVDDNHAAIVHTLRTCGAVVQSLAAIGRGCPDLLVSFRGQNLLIEVKDGRKPPSQRRLTADQVAWHSAWPGPVHVVECPEDALEVLGLRKAVTQ